MGCNKKCWMNLCKLTITILMKKKMRFSLLAISPKYLL